MSTLEASLLQRRPDVGDRAAGALLGLALGATRVGPQAAQDVRARLRHLVEAAGSGTVGVSAPGGTDPVALTGPTDGIRSAVGWVVLAVPLVLAGLGEGGDDPAHRIRELVGQQVDDPVVTEAAVQWGLALERAVRGDDRGQASPAAGQVTTALAPAMGSSDVGVLVDALAGARRGATAVPFARRRALHAQGGPSSGQLVRAALVAVAGGRDAGEAWPMVPMLAGARSGQAPFLRELPGDPGVLLGNLASLPAALAQVEAVVSLCRVGEGAVPDELEHHEVLLLDRADADANPNLEFVLADTARAVATLRAEGRRVVLHCLAGRSRTPSVAAAYLARRDGVCGLEAFERVAACLPHPDPHNRAFQRALARIGARGSPAGCG